MPVEATMNDGSTNREVSICQVAQKIITVGPGSSNYAQIPSSYTPFPHLVIPSCFNPTKPHMPLCTSQTSQKSLLNSFFTRPTPPELNFPLFASFHPFVDSFAFSKGNTVFIFNIGTQSHYPANGLSNHNQFNISCLKWNPQGQPQIAVASYVGVCLWNIYQESISLNYPGDDRSFISQNSHPQPWVKVLDCGLTGVSSMSWSPCGRFLAVGNN